MRVPFSKWAATVWLLTSSVTLAQSVKPRAGVIEESDGGVPRRQGRVREEGSALGRRLFADPLLSADGRVSCATCHDEGRGFTSGGLPKALDGGLLGRRAPSLVNVGNRPRLFWDGRAASLEAQAKEVLLNPREMGNKSMTDVLARLGDKYAGLGETDLLRSLAEYERGIVSPRTRFDAYREAKGELPVEAVRGWNLFRGAARCYKCHTTSGDFTDDGFHCTGVGRTDDAGRMGVTQRRQDEAAFKTPQLRGCLDSAPYMHDGSIKTLADVVEFYDGGGKPHPNLDREMKTLNLTRQQKADLVSFLKEL